MFFKIIFNFFIGYLNIQVEGFFVERFINICIAKNILLWGMNRKNSSILNANISVKDFKKIKDIAKKTKCRVKIEKKKGLPFIFNKYKKRKAFGILIIFIIILLCVLSGFVWNIEIKGIDKIPRQEILSIMEENGVKIGALKKNIDTKKVINQIRLIRNDVAWVGIEIKGTNAVVEIVEADPKPEILDESDFCNIIANKDGIITKINTKNGTSLVKVGDIVKEKDVLVEGKVQGKYTDAIYVHASADIEAKVWYKKKKKAYFHQQLDEKTGNTETKYQIKFNNLQINLYKTLSKFQNYDTISESKKINLFSNFYLPIEIIKLVNYEKKTHEIIYGSNELKENEIKQIEQELKDTLPNEANILNRYVNIREQDDGLEIEIIYEVLEKLGTNEKIIF